MRNLALALALVICSIGLGGGVPRVDHLTQLAAGQPVNHTPPTLTGDPRLGGVMECGRGDWDDPDAGQYAVTYQWVRDNVGLSGQTTATHTVVGADINHAVRCDVTTTGASGLATASSTTLYPPAPLALTTPHVSGDTRLRQTLTCNPATWNDDGVPAYSTNRAWLRNGSVIDGETSATHTITAADLGMVISCSESVGSLATSVSAGVYPTAPQNRSTPDVSGDTRLGGTLSCTRGTWDDEGLTPYAVAKQWLRDGVDIIGAVADKYVITALDINHGISCRVRAEELIDSTGSPVYPTGPTERAQPVIEGDPRLGGTLTCTRGTWDDQGRAADYTVSYEWYRSGVLVADTVQYDVTAADVNDTLRCQVVSEGLATASSQTIYISPPRNRALPLVSGDPRLGQTLNCSRGVWDDDATASYSLEYQWLRNGVEISGESEAAYAITGDDMNTGVSCRVHAAGLTLAYSATVYVQPPRILMSPRIEGDPRVGEQLHCTRGDWNDPAGAPYGVTYQWVRSGTPLDGATSASYVITADDLNQYFQCVVTTDGPVSAYSQHAWVTSHPTGSPAVNLSPPIISGDSRLRHVLTCNRGSWNDTAASRYPVTYRWTRNGIAIAGATSSQYTVAAADMGQSLSCDVIAAGEATASSNAISPATPEVAVAPGISGDPRLRGTLSCSRGDWYDEAADRYAVTYRWLRNGAPITAATAPTYQVTKADVNSGISCEVRAEGLTTATSGSVGVAAPTIALSPAVSGNPRVGSTLSCSRGTWEDRAEDRYAVAYHWMRNGVAIAGATGTSYTLSAGDVGAHVTCVVEAEDLTSAGSLNGAYAGAPENRVPPRVSGRARLRQTLTCSRGDWDDTADDRYAVTYGWLRDGTVIPGATSATYTIAAADVNHYVTCRVRAEDLSDASSPFMGYVYAPSNIISPSVAGAPRLFRELRCSRGDWDDTAADRYAVTYTWLRNHEPIAGATRATYVVQRDDVDASLACRVRAEGLTDATSTAAYVLRPTSVLAPSVSGQAHLRGDLACSRGTWDDTAANRYAVSYQWYRNGVPINSATDRSYVLGVNDVNAWIYCGTTAEGLTDSYSGGTYVAPPSSVIAPGVEGIAHPRRELTCTRGEWNDSTGRRYAVSYQWRRNGFEIPGADSADHVVVAEDVGAYLQCVVTAEGVYQTYSTSVYATWEPLQLSVVPDADAVAAGASDVYTVRLRNANPTPVVISTLDLTLPGGFSYRPGTTTGALTADPVPVGPGALTLRWNAAFTVPEVGDAVIRVGVTAASQVGDHFASARAYPADFAFTVPPTGLTARITVEGPPLPPAACTIAGTAGSDVLTGTPGADVICGLGGDDTLRGADGADQLLGGPGDDRLDGGAGADTLNGDDGADILEGGADGDRLRGGGGLDTLTYATRTTPVTVTLGSGNGDDGAVGEADTAGSDIEILRGGSAADDLTGGLGPDELYGRAGNDRLVGGDGGGDLLDGGDGADTLIDDDGQIDRLICGGGLDLYAADLLDRIVGCETAFSTQLTGGA